MSPLSALPEADYPERLLWGVDSFRQRTMDAGARVAARTGVDPLDVRRSVAVTADSRLELLPASVGIGAGLMALAAAAAGFGMLVDPTAAVGGSGIGVGLGLMCAASIFTLAVASTFVLRRTARGRRPMNELYEDAWARLAVELWPAPRYRGSGPFAGSAASYSRTEFLIALRNGADLERFALHAPFTRNP